MDLRKVMFRKVGEKSHCEMEHKGYFHKFATYAEDGNSEELAIVEDLEGNVIETYTTWIKFVK